MMYIVPFFSLTGLYWQYGLVLYWVTTNVWTLGQQYVMFRNWDTEPAQAAGAAAAASSPARAAPRSPRPAAGAASAAAAAGAAGTARATRAANGTKTAGPAKTGSASGGAQAGAGSGRPRPVRPAPAVPGGTGGSASVSTGSGAPRTGSARGDAAAASATPSGQNGGARRGLLGLGRKPEPVAEPEVPATKVVRQQPVRQAKSKRSGKR
jgi:YidC/Oxa1 family membrane protein insertase